MNYKVILGLDIGTNSIGWSLIKEYNDGTIEIIKTGVHIFPIGTIVDEKSGKEKTKNEQRRGYRGVGRNRFRFKLRRKNLKKILDSLGMLPDFAHYFKKKGKGQSFEFYELRANAINQNIPIPLAEIGRIFLLLNKYRGFKSNAKKLSAKESDTGLVKKGCEELEGFMQKREAKTIGEYFFKMHLLGKEMYNEDQWHNPNEPIDERAFNEDGELVLFNSNGIRRHFGRYTLRSMYEKEFDLIWKAQKYHYPDIMTGNKEEYDAILALPYQEKILKLKSFRETNYWKIRNECIFYQRPLKSSKRFVSECQFERGEAITKKINDKQEKIHIKKAKKVTPKSNPLFQEFRIWQKLHQISYSSIEDGAFQEKLKTKWLAPIADILSTNFDIYLNKTPKVEKENRIWIGKILKEQGLIYNPDSYTFFIDSADEDIAHEEKNANRITGNVTYGSFYEALGKEKYNELLNTKIARLEKDSNGGYREVLDTKLFALWQTIYMAKDGLFQEDDWLKTYLTESEKWKLTPESVNVLISNGLQSDYASYSAKVLKAILPFMREGWNEHEALKKTERGYINEDNTVGKKIEVKERVSQLKYQELRNPVVEKAVSKTIKLVNKILERYNEVIDQDQFEIRVESTRQLRKPRNEREKERKKNSDKDKLREEYATFLNKKNDVLGFKRKIFKGDSLINKYELWLEMNFDEDDELFKAEFAKFNKNTKAEDRLKHKLWLEGGRRCPYTGKTINITDLFSSNVEIEHIIPMSRSLDNSFLNKTLTYRETNALKGKMTAYEFAQKQGKDFLATFEANIKSNYHNFSDNKKKQFLAKEISKNFSNNQLTNTSYISKFIRSKLREVSRNVQFTNGSATSILRKYDWSLSLLLDKIRFEEEYGIDIDETYMQFNRVFKDFKNWYCQKIQSTDVDFRDFKFEENTDVAEYESLTQNLLTDLFVQKEAFNQFRNSTGKKDRSDHRQHAIDAFIISACSPRITQILSTYYAKLEEGEVIYRDKIPQNFDYEGLKASIKNILVSHSEKQSFIKKRINNIRTKDGVIKQTTYAPQGKLHEESFYAKRNGVTVRRVKLFDPQAQEKTAFSSVEKLNNNGKGEKWAYIPEESLYEITKSRIENLGKEAFLKEKMEDEPFYRTSPHTPDKKTAKKTGKPLPIVKSVRKRFAADKTLIQLPAKDESGNIINENRYADNMSNAMLVLYEKDSYDKKGKKKKSISEFQLISFYELVRQKKDGQLIFSDSKKEIGLKPYLNWLQKGDFIVSYESEFEKNKFLNNISDIPLKNVFKVKGLSSDSRTIKDSIYSYGYITPIKHNSTTNEDKISHTKLNFIKIKVNILGEIETFL